MAIRDFTRNRTRGIAHYLRMLATTVLGLTLMLLIGQSFVMAQTAPLPPPKPGSLAAREASKPSFLDVLPQILGAPAEGVETELPNVLANVGPAEARLTAKLIETGDPIPFGVTWRIFKQKPEPDGSYPLVASGDGGSWTQTLDPGDYMVHAAYGKAAATALLRVDGKPISETVILNAGGLRLQAQLTGDISIPPDSIRFRISALDSETTDVELIVDGARPGLILPLNAGTYRVESQYGAVNASVSADITVQEGKLTDATLYHRAAEVTLKLVNEPGGEAIANTSWTLLYPNGEVLRETVGAFPTFVLEEGDYEVIASHEGEPHNRKFAVQAGRHRDVEVLIGGE